MGEQSKVLSFFCIFAHLWGFMTNGKWKNSTVVTNLKEGAVQ
jgi:hypothetical protein